MAGTPLSGLQASSETLLALAAGLTRFGAAEGSSDWLVPFAWLCTEVAAYIATPMNNGLRIEPLASFLDRLRADVERIGANAGLGPLPAVPDAMSPPITLQPWKDEISNFELIRTPAQAAGLLFTGQDGAKLLVANDPLGSGLVLTSESVEVADLLTDAERVELTDYLGRAVRR